MRFYYLDAMRSILMILGVLYHAALIFAPDGGWRVSNPESHVAFGVLANFIRLFRMPAFFIIAGFFAQLSLERLGVVGFLKSRAQRLLLPCLSTLLFVNSLQFILTDRRLFRDVKSWSQLFQRLADWTLQGRTISHLWFLALLFFFVLLLPAGWSLARDLAPSGAWRLRGQGLWRLLCRRGLFLLLAPLCAVLSWVIANAAPPLYRMTIGDVLKVREVLQYLPFFCFGVLLFRSADLHRTLFQFRLWWVVALVLAQVFLWTQPQRAGLSLAKAAFVYSNSLTIWVVCILCFQLFQRHFNRTSFFFAYLSDASYSIYLFHHIFVILLGKLLLNVRLGCFTKYGLIVSTALLAAVAIHHFLILRIPLLRLLFNGKWQKGFTWRQVVGAPPEKSSGGGPGPLETEPALP